MSEESGWFHGLDPDDIDLAVDRIRDGSAPVPRQWPRIAVETSWAPDESTYYDRLHTATVTAAERASAARETASDRQLIEAVRTMDDLDRMVNELAERVTDWGTRRFGIEMAGLDGVRAVASRTPTDPIDDRLIAVAAQTEGLAEESTALRQLIEAEAPLVAPNLSALAGPVLAARLMALAGGLESLAKMPSGTVQVLGAEEALFAHLRGTASAPKHGVIVTHPAIRSMPPAERGSAARALAGKLSIAARIDHYSGDRRPELEADLEERLDTIRSRGDGS